MKLNMMAVLLDFDGDPIEEDVKPGQPKKPVTLGSVLASALNTPGPDYPQETPGVKFTRGFLAVQCRTKDELDVTAEDIVLMKKCVAAVYSPLVIYRVHLALEGKDMNPEHKSEEPGAVQDTA